MKDFFLERLQEGSTWKSLFWVVAAFGLYHFTPEQENALTALALALAGGSGIVIPDRVRRK